jgi:hypothetical protein
MECLWRWGTGALNNPHVRKAWDDLADGVQGEMLGILDDRVSFKEGRPQGSGLSTEEVREVYEDALRHVADTSPTERAEDRSIYGYDAAPREEPNRNPSMDSAARELASADLGMSRRTLRRRLPKTKKSPK